MDPPPRTMLLRFTFLLLLAASASGVVHDTEPPPYANGGPPKTLEHEHSNVPPSCNSSEPHHEFILLQNGSLLLPGSNELHEFDTYYLANDTAFLCRVDEESGAHNFSEEFLKCGGHILIDASEFELLDSGDVRIDIYNRTYAPTDYYMDRGGVFVCVPDFADMAGGRNETPHHTLDKFPPEFTYVTFAGLSVSVVSLLSHLAVFCSVSTARNLPGCCLASLSASLLLAYACFLAVASMDAKSDGCARLGLCVYYFFLTSFFWMNAIAFDVWRSFRSVMRELRISSHRMPWRRFLTYSLYCWAVPGLLVVVVRVLDSVDDVVPGDLRPMFGEVNCWFGSRLALLVFFAVPLLLVMLLNAAFFLDVTCVISRATLKTSSQEATLRKRFFMFMRLGLIMGLTWIVGLVAALVDHVSIWYAFIVLNTLQGLFIFVVFSCSSKVKGLLCGARYRKRGKKRGSTSVRISQISGQV